MNPRVSPGAYMDVMQVLSPFLPDPTPRTVLPGRRPRHGQVRMQKRRPGTRSGSEAPPVPVDRADSFEAFFADHHADLFGAMYLITRNRHEAEEIMQDAFLKVLERWDHVSSLADPVGYLYRTAMNLFRKRWRRASLMLRRTVGFTPPDDEISLIERRVDVVRAVASLSPRQRAVIVLTDLLDFSSEEAARMLGVRSGTVRMHASRARAALASMLEEER
jgi:RNA polymerase sigma-70 factor, ECF subfamily